MRVAWRLGARTFLDSSTHTSDSNVFAGSQIGFVKTRRPESVNLFLVESRVYPASYLHGVLCYTYGGKKTTVVFVPTLRLSAFHPLNHVTGFSSARKSTAATSAPHVSALFERSRWHLSHLRWQKDDGCSWFNQSLLDQISQTQSFSRNFLRWHCPCSRAISAVEPKPDREK